jgi:kynurenine formamidase
VKTDKLSSTNFEMGRRVVLKRASAVALGALMAKAVPAAEPDAKKVTPDPDSEVAKMQAYMDPPPPGKEDRSCDPREYFKELSNWGRWGKDDVFGTLNLITPDVVAAAAALVRKGIAVSCSWNIQPWPTHDSLQRHMHILPNEVIGGSEVSNNVTAAGEYISMRTHGLWTTHVDALSHVFWDGKMYNGFPGSSVTATDGVTKCDMAAIKNGIVSRGVLLDIAALLGVQALEGGYAVTPEQLEAAEKRQQVKVRTGDVVLLHTGHGRRVQEAGGFLPPSHPMPGWHPRCLPWLHKRGVAAVGCDAAHDPFPTGFAWSGHFLPFHDVGIVAMGLWLIDWWNLQDLVAKCHELGRFEFQIVIASLRLRGCSASPVNPIAIF